MPFDDPNSTIAAISSPPGVGGIATIRVSGSDAISIADKIWRGKSLGEAQTHTAHLGMVLDSSEEELDQAVATVFRAPKSFTGEDTVEFSVHGSIYVQKEILASLIRAGARLANPGEFTRRAYISGKLSLTEAEAVADIIDSDSRAAHRLAMNQLKGGFDRKIASLRDELLQLISLLELELDFSEEDVTFADRNILRQNALAIKDHISNLLDSFVNGNAIKTGVPVAIIGPTNVGKSSLLNALVEDDRAIVSDIHGTTRDTVEETAAIGPYKFRFIDTAGIRNTSDPIEKMGIERSKAAINKAHIIINLIDSTAQEEGLHYADCVKSILQPHQTQIVVYNKSDLCRIPGALSISAKTLEGIDCLRKTMITIMDKRNVVGSNDDIIVTNQRHAESLERALNAAVRTLEAMDRSIPSDLVAQDARAIINHLSEVTGHITNDEVLGNIFSRFCIGK